MEKLRQIFESVRERADTWRTSSTTQERYEGYLNSCYHDIWDLFWQTANQIEVYVDYCDPDTSYEEDMQAKLNSYDGIDWTNRD